MHHIYNTEAIVLMAGAAGEADRAVWLLTQELGLLVARATSAREEKSKMRYGLQDFSVANVSLVKGRAYWRLTGTILAEQFYTKLKDTDTLQTVAVVFDLIRRFIPIEEQDSVLYGVIRSGLLAFTKSEINKHSTELLLVARILHALGYMPENLKYNELMSSDVYDVDITADIKAEIVKDTNNAIANTDL